MKWVHHRPCLRQCVLRCRVVAGEPIHRDDFHPVSKCLIAFREPAGECSGRTAGNHVQQPGGTGAVDGWGEVDDDGDETWVTPPSNVFPLVLVHAEDPHSVERPGLLVDKMLHGGDGKGIDHVPTHTQRLGHRRDRHLVDREAVQDPPGGPPGDGSLRRRNPIDALAKHRNVTTGIVAGEP